MNNEADAISVDTDGSDLVNRIMSNAQSMQRFHTRCGRRITLSDDQRTATRSIRDFSHALVFSSEPLINDIPFEVVIEKKVRRKYLHNYNIGTCIYIYVYCRIFHGVEVLRLV